MDVDASLFFNSHTLRSGTRYIAAAIASCVSLAASAAPTILEAIQTLQVPDSYFTSIEDVDIDGDFLIMGARHSEPIDESYGDYYTDAAFLFRRGSGGHWVLVRKLFEERSTREDDGRVPVTVAMENGVAAINAFRTMYVFERVNDDWVARPIQGHARGQNVEIDAGTILGSESTCGWGADTYRKNAAGTYVVADHYYGIYDYCDDGQIAGDSDISGTRVVIPQPNAGDDPSFVPSLWVWEGPQPSTPTAIPLLGSASIEGDWITIGAEGTRGTHFFKRQGLGNWIEQQAITMPDAMLAPAPNVYQGVGALQMDDGFVLQGRSGNTDVFQRDAQSKYRYVAKLIGADRKVNVSGRTAVAIAPDGVKVFELPTNLVQPELRQDDFQDGNAADWTPQAGSNYGVVTVNGSYVYRQSSVAGNAISILGNTDLTGQAIQVDVTPTAFNGSDRWFGLIARYTDASNYYYVTVRQSNVIQIRRIVNGVFQYLGSTTLPVTLNRTYSLRFEAIGSTLRAYVDNKQVLEVWDFSHPQGQVGLMTYKTSANYDNVTVSAQKFLPLLTDDFSSTHPNRWTESGGTWGQTGFPQSVYQQTSLAGTARAITGLAAGDQMVQVNVVPTSFASGTERWFGVIARYVDVSNYYYVTLRTNNTISLRRLINGAIQELDSAPLTVQAGTTYRIRLDAIGNSLRVWVNGKHLLEATDSTFPAGKYGLATYKASAQFDDFVSAQP